MSAPLDLLAGVVAQETALGTTSPTMSGGRPRSKRMRLAEGDERRAGSPSSDEAAQERSDGDTSSGRPVEQSPADSKRALRAERNRQSAAASRERKKRHVKELENQVHYLGEANAALQYNSHMERQAWAEKEKALEAEIAGLKKRLLASSCDIRDLRSQLSTAAKSPS